MTDSERDPHAPGEPGHWWQTSEVAIADCRGVTVAYLPGTDDDAWISGWVDVPR